MAVGGERRPPGPAQDNGSPGESSASDEDILKQFQGRDRPARPPAEMKAFLDKRLQELKALGGTWKMLETKHFYCFSNGPEARLPMLSQWNETLYERLCTVLRHKEGEKLWNNKCPVYFFDRVGQFRQFAAEIDKQPNAAMSGGYFFAEGRDVHICIPFMMERVNNQKAADRIARNTLNHECTHAFLQLTGENVPLTRWLHEGMAQFIEFWYDRENNADLRENNPERRQRVAALTQFVRGGHMPSWEEMRMRPRGGTDVEGYAFAWSKLEFLFRCMSDNQKLPTMIRLIKGGKTEDEAMKQAYGYPVEKLEEVYRTWLKDQCKRGFKFEL